MKKKILIYEDESKDYGPYNFANELELDNQLDLTFVTKSQQKNMRDLPNFDVIFLDIQLAKTSAKDGYAILETIQSAQPDILNRVVVVTGNGLVASKLNEMGLADKVKVLIKPIGYIEISNEIKSRINFESIQDTH